MQTFPPGGSWLKPKLESQEVAWACWALQARWRVVNRDYAWNNMKWKESKKDSEDREAKAKKDMCEWRGVNNEALPPFSGSLVFLHCGSEDIVLHFRHITTILWATMCKSLSHVLFYSHVLIQSWKMIHFGGEMHKEISMCRESTKLCWPINYQEFPTNYRKRLIRNTYGKAFRKQQSKFWDCGLNLQLSLISGI